MDQMTHTLLLTHYITGKAKYLEPIRSLAKARLRYLSSPPKKEPAPGTEAWCASRLGGLSSVIAKYRFLTGNTEFDELIGKESLPYIRFRMDGDFNSLVSALGNNAEALRVNFEGYTSEVRYTDRVLRFPRLFTDNDTLAESAVTIHTPNPSLLYSTVTGDPGGAGYFPLNAVRWLTESRNIAALVTESGTEEFAAELFHFGLGKRPMSAEFYLLKGGEYILTLTAKNGEEQKPLITDNFVVKGGRTQVFFELPPRELCTLNIRRR
jgi:hypothetical protein